MVCDACLELAAKLRKLRKMLFNGLESEPLEVLDEVAGLLNLNLRSDLDISCHLDCPDMHLKNHTCGRLGPADRRDAGCQVDRVELEDIAQMVRCEADEEHLIDVCVDTQRSDVFKDWLAATARDGQQEKLVGADEADILDGGLSGMLVPLRLFEQYLKQVSKEGSGAGAIENPAGNSGKVIDFSFAPQDCGTGEQGLPSAPHLSSFRVEEAVEAGYWVEMNKVIRSMMNRGLSDADILMRLKDTPGGHRIQGSLLARMRSMFTDRSEESEQFAGWRVQQEQQDVVSRERSCPAAIERGALMAVLRSEKPTYSIDTTLRSVSSGEATPCSEFSQSPLPPRSPLRAASPFFEHPESPSRPDLQRGSVRALLGDLHGDAESPPAVQHELQQLSLVTFYSDSDDRSVFDTRRRALSTGEWSASSSDGFGGGSHDHIHRKSKSPQSPGLVIQGPTEMIGHIVL